LVKYLFKKRDCKIKVAQLLKE